MLLPANLFLRRYCQLGLILACLGAPALLPAQPFRAFATSNSAGLLGVDLNPASIVDSRFRSDILLFGTEADFSNNFLSIRTARLFNGELDWGSAQDFRNNFNVLSGGDIRDISTTVGVNGPGVLLTLSPKSAIAFTTRSRLVFTGSDLPTGLLQFLLSGGEADDLIGQTVRVGNAALTANALLEVGATYGRVLLDRGQHFIKAAGRVKFIQGIGAYSLRFDNATFTFRPNDLADVARGSRFNLAYTEDIDFNNRSEPTVGLDFGVIYEWRPNYQRYTYAMDGERDQVYRDRSKYKLRVGVSVVDIGRVRYQTRAADLALNVTTDNFVWDLRNIQQVFRDEVNVTRFADQLSRDFANNSTTNSFEIGLPTMLTAQVDWSLGRNFFVNFLTTQPLSDGVSANRIPGAYTLAPRLESRFVDVILPLTYDASGRPDAGVAARFGFFLIGTNRGLTTALRDNIASADAYIAARIGLRYGTPGDRDADGVSNQEDECPGKPGSWEFRGCPDTDGDHIPDKSDRCPEEPGLPSLFGCPDTDEDGIADSDDQCPQQPGPASNKGCPPTVPN